jgi:hypothetical protein
MLLLIVKLCHGYVTVYLGCIGCINDYNAWTNTHYRILKMSVNRALMIVGRVSWVIWGCDRSNIVPNKVLAAFIAKKANETILTPS